MNRMLLIALTGGPCGGKTRLIEELSRDAAWAGRFLALPEAIEQVGRSGISIREKAFQKEMVRVQMAQEDETLRGGAGTAGLVLCERGSLDPLAYWLDNGWLEAEFFEYTETTLRLHYRRYAAVLHLVSTADGAEQSYRCWPEVHRRENLDEARRLDQLLQNVWRWHENYSRVDNLGKDWQTKSDEAKVILGKFINKMVGE